MARKQLKHGTSEYDLALRDDDRFGALLNEALPDTINFTALPCYGITRGEEVLVIWCFNSFFEHTEHNIRELEASVSIASCVKDWKPLRTIRLILSLFFKDTCYNRLTAVTHSKNRQAIRLVKLAGFTLEGILRKPASIENIMQFSILREDWQRGRFYG